MSVVMLVAFTTGVTLAEQKVSMMKKMTGTVIRVDATKGVIVIGQEETKKHEILKAEPNMLAGITRGEVVTIETSREMVKSIKPAVERTPAGTHKPAPVQEN
jgi:hypothetical protein